MQPSYTILACVFTMLLNCVSSAVIITVRRLSTPKEHYFKAVLLSIHDCPP